MTASNEPSRIPASDIETLILARLKELLGSPEQVVTSLSQTGDDVALTRDLVEAAGQFATNLNQHSAASVNEMLTAFAFRATAGRELVSIQLRRHAIRAQLLGPEVDANHRDAGNDKDLITIAIPAKLSRCKGEMRLIIPDSADNQRRQPITSLVKAVSRAHDWVRRMENGEFKDQRAIAAATGLDERYISHILPSAFLAPNIVESILAGNHAQGMSLGTLLKHIPLNWDKQHY